MKPTLFSRLLGRRVAVPEAKASRTGPLLALQGQGRAQWTPRDLAALAREGYMKNAVVYRAVTMIAEAAASVPILAYRGEAEAPDHPLLALLARPNRRQGGAEFLETLYANLLVAGNAYAELVRLGAAPAELHALRPDRMRVVPGPEGWPEAYEYSVAGRKLRFVDPGEGEIAPILHLRLFHPLDDHYGFSPLEAAAVALDIHNAAGAWNKALLDNSARPSGALVYRGEGGANLSQDQFERLKRELEANYTGALSAGRPLLLEGGLDWTSMALTPRDMDFMEAKNGAAREIAFAFGVPPMLIGIPGDNTYANYAEANRRTQAAIRKLKDAEGNYLWQPAAVAGGEASLLGFPVTEAEDMPDIGANALSLAFGDFKRGYLVVDRLGVSVLRDPYSAKPYVLFYTVKRVGGGVQDFDAIKLLKFGTS